MDIKRPASPLEARGTSNETTLGCEIWNVHRL